jgi:hypothetical protein
MLRKLFGARKAAKLPPKTVVVVSGLPRSGTSMMMKMLEAGGLPILTDNLRTPDEDNPKGYYEFERVKKLNKGDTAWLRDADGKAVKVISALVKYLPPDYDYRVIFMHRNLREVMASQRKMLIRRGEDPDKTSEEEMMGLFSKHVRHVLEWMRRQPNFSLLEVHYNAVLRDPEAYACQVNEFLGGFLDERAMTAVIDPSLYRNRAA